MLEIMFSYALAAAAIAATWALVLRSEIRFIDSYISWLEEAEEKYELPLRISKPLGGCTKCFAGQIAFWSYLLSFGLPSGVATLLLWFGTASSAVIIGLTLEHFIVKWEN